MTNTVNKNQEIVDAALTPVKTFIQSAVSQGFPSMVILRFSGEVDWNVNGVWARDLELKVTPPYASLSDGDIEGSVKAIWDYALRPLDFITPVPFENLGDLEPAVESATVVIQKLKDSIEKFPYLSRHHFTEDGISVTAELSFKP